MSQHLLGQPVAVRAEPVAVVDDGVVPRLAALGPVTPHIEQIQDAVEAVLFDAGHRATLRAYIVYREQHRKLRDARKSLVDVEASMNEYLNQTEGYYCNMFIMRNYFQSLPASLEESASLDGAKPLRILLSIILPLSLPVIAALGLFYGIFHWNAFFDGIFGLILGLILIPLSEYVIVPVANVTIVPLINGVRSLFRREAS